MQDMIRSFVPGRLRARHPGLLGMDAESLAQTTETILALEGITDVAINPRVGSIKIEWDPNVLSEEDLAGYLAMYEAMLNVGGDDQEAASPVQANAADAKTCACIDSLLEKGARLIAPGQKNAKRAKRMAQNRLMLALLGGSVASLASGSYRVHAVLGWSFVGLLALHLYQHRNVL